MAIDIKGLTHIQLAELIEKAKARQHEVVKTRVVELREKIEQMVKKEGFTLDEIFPARGKRGPAKGGAKVAPKYKNPADPAQTWSGRGKRPNWFKAALKGGKKEADLLIK